MTAHCCIFTAHENSAHLLALRPDRPERSRRGHDFSEEHDQGAQVRDRVFDDDVRVTPTVTRQRKSVAHLWRVTFVLTFRFQRFDTHQNVTICKLVNVML
jgi:hypothetical protein